MTATAPKSIVRAAKQLMPLWPARALRLMQAAYASAIEDIARDLETRLRRGDFDQHLRDDSDIESRAAFDRLRALERQASKLPICRGAQSSGIVLAVSPNVRTAEIESMGSPSELAVTCVALDVLDFAAEQGWLRRTKTPAPTERCA